jgi:glutamine amidotransferase
MTTVSIIDYGSGNLFSVMRAFEQCGARPVLVNTPEDVRAANHLVLPGVGAFADGMHGLNSRGLAEAIQEHARSGRPTLGICLGMQMLATGSEEFGLHAGLNLVAGKVQQIPRTNVNGELQKVPFIGWGKLEESQAGRWHGTLMSELAPGSAVYLVHSYHLLPDDPRDQLAFYEFGGHRITAAVQAGSIIGCQFHPEKSGPTGLGLLKGFLRK